MEKWSGLAGKTATDCIRILLTCTRKWQFFGATLFEARAKTDNQEIWLAINEEGVCMLSHQTMQVIERFPYPTIVTFGGCQEDFMLVVSGQMATTTNLPTTERLLFTTSKPRILEMTLLIADYMNMMGQHLPKGTPRSTVHSRSVSRTRLHPGLTTSSTPNTPRLAGREVSSVSLARSGSTASSVRRANKPRTGTDL